MVEEEVFCQPADGTGGLCPGLSLLICEVGQTRLEGCSDWRRQNCSDYLTGPSARCSRPWPQRCSGSEDSAVTETAHLPSWNIPVVGGSRKNNTPIKASMPEGGHCWEENESTVVAGGRASRRRRPLGGDLERTAEDWTGTPPGQSLEWLAGSSSQDSQEAGGRGTKAGGAHRSRL